MKRLCKQPMAFLLAALTLGAAGCSDDCSENKNALPLAGFYSISDPIRKVQVSGLEVIGVGAPGDSVLSEASVTKDEVYLPFRIDSDTTSYAFRYYYVEEGDSVAKAMADTLTFIYTRTPRLASAECGVSYRFDIRDIRKCGALIDSVACPEGYIDNQNVMNLKIFFAAAPDAEDQPQ